MRYFYLSFNWYFRLVVVFISFFVGWLTLNSRSLWPAVFARDGINSIMTILFEMDFGEHKFKANFAILAIWGVIGVISYLLISNNYTRVTNNGA